MNLRCWVAALAATSTCLVAYAADKEIKTPPSAKPPLIVKKDDVKPLPLPPVVTPKVDATKPPVIRTPLQTLPLQTPNLGVRKPLPAPDPGPGGPGPGLNPGGGSGTLGPIPQIPMGRLGDREAAQKYRVTLLGFRVNKQTRDNFLEDDGPGDEIVVRCWTRLANDGETKQEQLSGINAILGKDTGRGNNATCFLRAGSANPREGGLRTGDSFPLNPSAPAPGAPVTWHPVGDNFNRNVAVPAGRFPDYNRFTGRFPLVVFEGAIGAKDVVSIAPTLWEWDDFGKLAAFSLPHAPGYKAFWTTLGTENRLTEYESRFAIATSINRTVKAKATELDVALNTVPDPRRVLREDQKLPAIAFHSGGVLKLPKVEGDMGGNRGIGCIDGTDGEPILFTAPKVLLLTATSADKLAELTLPAQAKGVLEVRMKDDTPFEGDYTVFLHIEKVR